ncbi:hypothetical protein HDE_02710 [Halotydeus destructor]|nr:hypothetical protein HDE_02710 [Halotydeus destructor]
MEKMSTLKSLLSLSFQLLFFVLLVNLFASTTANTSWESRHEVTNDVAPSDKLFQQELNEAAMMGLPLSTDQSAYIEKLSKFLNSKRLSTGRWVPYADQLESFKKDQKRQQIRYHQCYFNPISCFRKRK